jgi:hypothetical protein
VVSSDRQLNKMLDVTDLEFSDPIPVHRLSGSGETFQTSKADSDEHEYPAHLEVLPSNPSLGTSRKES